MQDTLDGVILGRHITTTKVRGMLDRPLQLVGRDSQAVGCVRIIDKKIAFVCMQESVTDPAGRNFGECIHHGKVGKYSLEYVGKRLAQMDSEEIEEYQNAVPEPCGRSCNPCHDHNALAPDPTCIKSWLQNMLRCAYGCLLPVGVQVLNFHHREEMLPESESDTESESYPMVQQKMCP